VNGAAIDAANKADMRAYLDAPSAGRHYPFTCADDWHGHGCTICDSREDDDATYAGHAEACGYTLKANRPERHAHYHAGPCQGSHAASVRHGTEVTNVWHEPAELAACAVCGGVIADAEDSGEWRHVPELYEVPAYARADGAE
jgi:hypothetical protein